MIDEFVMIFYKMIIAKLTKAILSQFPLQLRLRLAFFSGNPATRPPGLHKTGIHGIQDTRQIVDGKTNDKENNAKKVGSDFLT